MSQTQQKALLLQSKQGSFVVSTISKPLRVLPGELLVKVMASGLNPGDWKVKEFGWFFTDSDYPLILGADVAGEVEDVGEGVTGFEKGDRVSFNGKAGKYSEYAGYQQYARAPAESTCKVCAIHHN
jgi:NADPH:quinone reductase-like Zn-dependent oxidoreductase